MDIRTLLFRLEMRLRARLGWDCTSCIQRQINRVAIRARR